MSDPYNPELVDSIKTDGDDYGVNTIKIGEINYALLSINKMSLKLIDVSNP